ncbi:MAG: hypothetical protein G01um101433_1048 [Parcubacteria group bacterium Gr01-1014_33]|nr:MAG: hypothetical protein G01um101433_1048 [Parcubacteria group bacterium Gr01-1014_33]
MEFTLDTNILIYYAKGDAACIEFMNANLEKDALILPTIVTVEFLAFPVLTLQERELFLTLLLKFRTVALDTQIAFLAADIRKNKVKLGDSVIAATALFTHTALATRNLRDFKKIKELTLYSL